MCLWLLAVLVCGCGAVTNSRQNAFIGYAEAQEIVVINTDYGEIQIKPLKDIAPRTAKQVVELARSGKCPNCHFYRHEPVPKNWGVSDFWGPPYALLQGTLADLPEKPEWEATAAVTVRKGHACIIPNSKEFFIATADHPEWGNSHVVWGKVDDLSAALRVPVEPFFTRTDGGKIVTRWLNNTYPFKLSLRTALPHT